MPTAAEPGFLDYLRAAFSARRKVKGLGGVPLNYLYLLGVGVAGIALPGLWLVGLGGELAYLAWLAHHPRFRSLVKGDRLRQVEQSEQQRLEALAQGLQPEALARFRRLEARCDALKDTSSSFAAGVHDVHHVGLSSLLQIYGRLLLSRQTLAAYLKEAQAADLERRVAEGEKRLAAASSEAMKRPLQANLELLRRRLGQQAGARENLQVVDAELERLENQVELLREEAAVNRDPAVLSARIDAVARTIGETSSFLKANEALIGDLGPEAAPVARPHRSSATGEKE